MIEALEQELKRREYIEKVVDNAISAHFKPSTSRLKRGAAQQSLLKFMGLGRSSFLCSLINERMKLAGFLPAVSHGEFFYKNVEFTEQ